MRTAAIAIVGLLIVGALAWNAAEMHYENCVEAAKARGTGSRAEAILEGRQRVAELVEGCSRLPW